MHDISDLGQYLTWPDQILSSTLLETRTQASHKTHDPLSTGDLTLDVLEWINGYATR